MNYEFCKQDQEIASTHSWVEYQTSTGNTLICIHCKMRAARASDTGRFVIYSTQHFNLHSSYFKLTCDELILMNVLK